MFAVYRRFLGPGPGRVKRAAGGWGARAVWLFCWAGPVAMGDGHPAAMHYIGIAGINTARFPWAYHWPTVLLFKLFGGYPRFGSRAGRGEAGQKKWVGIPSASPQWVPDGGG